jgi:hypothetical protein
VKWCSWCACEEGREQGIKGRAASTTPFNGASGGRGRRGGSEVERWPRGGEGLGMSWGTGATVSGTGGPAPAWSRRA